MIPKHAASALVSRRHVFSAGILLVENVLRIGVVAIVSFWIAHALGPAEFGRLNHASALVGVFWIAALLGLETPLTNRLTKASEPGKELGSAMALRVVVGLLASLLAVALTVVIAGPHDKDSVLLVGIISVSIPLSAPYLLDVWFKLHNDAVPAASARLLATILSCGAKAGCLLGGWGVVALAWTVVLEALLTSLFLFWAYRYSPRWELSASLRWQWRQSAEILHSCLPFFLSATITAVYMKIDLILLGYQVSKEETGIYGLSIKLVEVLYLVPVIVGDVLYPQLVKQQSNHALGSSATPQAFFDFTIAVALVATVVAIATVHWFVPRIFGEPYRPTVDVFLIHAWACIGIAMAHARYKWMAACGLQRLAPWVTLVGLVLTVVGNLLLVPRYGAMGAAAATASAFFVSGCLASFAFPALRPAACMQVRALWPWFRLWRAMRRPPSLQVGGM